MGFKYVNRVYRYVKGTTGTQQAVLAYLAFKADDITGASCYPTAEQIAEETHFKITAVKGALQDLKRLGLISWRKGGRPKGGGGRALANDYSFNLPDKQPTSIGRQTTNASAARRPMHRPPDDLCIGRQTATIIHDHSYKNPSVHTEETEGYESAEKAMLDEQARTLGKAFREEHQKEVAASERPKATSPIAEAMKVCGVSDADNYRVFCSVMLTKRLEDCCEEICVFESELRQGVHKNLTNPAAVLVKRLKKLPDVRSGE